MKNTYQCVTNQIRLDRKTSKGRRRNKMWRKAKLKAYYKAYYGAGIRRGVYVSHWRRVAADRVYRILASKFCDFMFIDEMIDLPQSYNTPTNN